jgi:hypothetical protein
MRALPAPTAPPGLFGSSIIGFGPVGIDRPQRQERVPHDIERRIVRLVAMLDQGERARERWLQRPHDKIRHVLGDSHLGNDGHAEI